MNTALLTKLFTNLKHDDLSFAYTGSFSDAITVKMVDLARYSIESQGKDTGLKNKVSFLMGECYQNIVRHGINVNEALKLHEKSNIFFLRSIEGNYFITSANQVENNAIADIKSKLDRVNSLSPDELKDLQKQILTSGEISEKGGAGIGIILIARKTEQKLVYNFEKVNDEISIFYLHVKLQLEHITKGSTSSSVSIEKMIELHNSLVNEGILIMHKGDFSKETFLPVIKMIEGNLGNKFEQTFVSTKLYHISVEILQNISIHGYKINNVNNGIFTLGTINDQYIIGTANYIENSKVERLKQRLEELKNLSKQELNVLYRGRLMMVLDDNDLGVGLGLIDIFRDSQSVDYSIHAMGDASLFSIVVKI